MGTTPRFLLPMLAPGQAQKELFHNEALQLLDMIVAAAVETLPSNTPPSAPAVGSCYLIGAIPVGDWSGNAGKLTCFTAGGWRFVVPREGMSAFIKSSGIAAAYRASAWEIGTLAGSRVQVGGLQVVGPRTPAIPAPSSGSVTDLEARATIGQILVALRQHGLIET